MELPRFTLHVTYTSKHYRQHAVMIIIGSKFTNVYMYTSKH